SWLEWIGPGPGGMMVLSGDKLTFGRRSQNDVVIKDERVSKIHASIHREGQDWYIRDWCSANGTLVNGERVAEKKLQDGDVVRLGSTEVVFHSGGVPSGASGISIVPTEGEVQASLVCEPGSFRPEREVQDERELRADYERLRVAYLFNLYMGRERDERALLKNILNVAFELLPADRGAILYRDTEGAPLTPAVSRHRDRDEGVAPKGTGPEGPEIVIPDSILKKAVEERSAVLSGDAMVDRRFAGADSVVSENIRSAMCVPLLGRDEVLGAIHLDTREQTGAFSVKDLQLFSVLGGQASAMLERARLQKLLEMEAATRDRLSRFLSPEVIAEVSERKLDLAGEGRTGRVTVLFCDVRGFSQLAESMQPQQLVRMLNAFFERMVDVVFSHRGVLDKFIGDALMAVWGAPIRKRNHASAAVQAAREMLQATELFNQSASSQGWPRLEVGVGVNTGEAVIGTVGSSRRMEYTVMGDAVNLASRICDLASGGQVLLTGETVKEIRENGDQPPRVRDLPPVKVRGKKNPVDVFEVI
ncbi:adenylate/guanylate cyclase domain-containing protein, partial [Myxococcota bacterium]